MKKSEAEEIKKLIDSFVEEEATYEEVTEVKKEPITFTEDELQKLFRKDVPAGFDLSKAEVINGKATGDRVFLKFGNERRHIPDPETLERLGFTFADVKQASDEEMREMKEGFGLLSVKLW